MARKKQETTDAITTTNQLSPDVVDSGSLFSPEIIKVDENRAGGPPSPMPPADDDDFFSPENIRLAQQFAPAEKSSTLAIELRKPPGDTFIKIHPDPKYSMTWPAVEHADTLFVLHPRVAQELESDPRMATLIKPVRFVVCAIHGGPFFIWPVKQPTDPTNQSAIHKAFDQAISFGMAGWVRITWNPKLKHHDCIEYRGPSVSEPVWPDRPFTELLKIAIGDSRMIKSTDHTTIRKLAGLEM